MTINLPHHVVEILKELWLRNYDLHGKFLERTSNFIGDDLKWLFDNLDYVVDVADERVLRVLQKDESGGAPAHCTLSPQVVLKGAILGLINSYNGPNCWFLADKAEEINELYSFFPPGESPLAEFVVDMADNGISHDDVVDAYEGNEEQMKAICKALNIEPEDVIGAMEPMNSEFDHLELLEGFEHGESCGHELTDKELDMLAALEERLASAEAMAEQVAKNTAAIEKIQLSDTPDSKDTN